MHRLGERSVLQEDALRSRVAEVYSPVIVRIRSVRCVAVLFFYMSPAHPHVDIVPWAGFTALPRLDAQP